MDTKKLRQKILDLAIRGKLVPQDPNDEPASVLLERIKAEKEQLIKDGKIKRSKKSASSDTSPYENVPFEIPESWVWTTIGDIFIHNTGKALNAANNDGVLMDYITTSNLYWDKFDLTVVKQMLFTDTEIEKCTVKYGDLLVCEGGDIGRAAIWTYDYDVRIQNHIHRLRGFCNISHRFYYYIFLLYKMLNLIGGKGVAIQGLSSNDLHKLVIPLPPIKEQCRIVSIIESWFSVIDRVEQEKKDLCNAIKQIKSKILDLAIHGKLVSQDPNDEPAIELLRRINPSFKSCDNGHKWKLPQSWCWAKGRQIFLPMKSTKPHNDEFLYIDIDSIDNKRQIINKIKSIKTANAPSRASRYTQKGDVVFSMVRPYLRNIAKVSVDGCIASTGFYVCSPIDDLNSEYCYYLMISDYVVTGLNQFMKGDNSPSINKSHIDEWLFPLPPFPEQQRIVQKIEKLFSLLDHIKKSLEV